MEALLMGVVRDQRVRWAGFFLLFLAVLDWRVAAGARQRGSDQQAGAAGNHAAQEVANRSKAREGQGADGASSKVNSLNQESVSERGGISLETLVECPQDTADGCLSFGFSYPHEGSALAPEGSMMKNGYILWAEMVNSAPKGLATRGGKSYRVTLKAYDDESSASIAETAYLSLISDVDFLLGPYGTSLTESANRVANVNNRVIVFANAASEDIFRKGYPKIFGVGTTASHYAESAIFELYRKGARSATIMYSTSSFTTSVANGAITSLAAAGMELKEIAGYDGDLSRSVCENIMMSLRLFDPDIFFAFVLLREAKTVVNVAKALNWKPRAFFITSAPSDPEFVAEMGSNAFYLLGPSQWESSLPYTDPFFGSASDYALKFTQRFNETPSFIAAQSTAAARILQLGIENAVPFTDEDTLGLAIQKLGPVQTFYGPISFNRAGSNNAKPVFVTQVRPPNGRIAVVAPEPVRVEEMIYPVSISAASSFDTSLFTVTFYVACLDVFLTWL